MPRLYGDVSLAVPPVWQMLGYMLFAMVVAGVAFVAAMSYERVENVGGRIVLDRGIVPIVPTRAGVVLEIAVRNGQQVEAGTPLVRILAGESALQGGLVQDRVLEAIGTQEQGLSAQARSLEAGAAAEQSRVLAQIAGSEQELRSLDRQIEAQEKMLTTARADLKNVQEVARRGYISRRDVTQRENEVFAHEQRLASLEQARTAKNTALIDARRSLLQNSADARRRSAELSVTGAELAQRRINTQAAREYVITAPVRGTVTGITAHVGQTATGQASLLTMIPAGARPRVELHVPSRAAGFLEEGQQVHVAVDAFPYQQFGRMQARISEISEAAVEQAGEGASMPVYVVIADLQGPLRLAGGRRIALLPGMTLSAQIVTNRERLLHTLTSQFRPGPSN